MQCNAMSHIHIMHTGVYKLFIGVCRLYMYAKYDDNIDNTEVSV